MTSQSFERFMLDFEARMVTSGEHKVRLLVDNFSRHQIPIIGSRLCITQLEFLPLNTTSRFQPMDARIISSFKAQYHKRMIEHKINCLMSTQNPEFDVYQVIVMIVQLGNMGLLLRPFKICWSRNGIQYTLPTNQALLESHQKKWWTCFHANKQL